MGVLKFGPNPHRRVKVYLRNAGRGPSAFKGKTKNSVNVKMPRIQLDKVLQNWQTIGGIVSYKVARSIGYMMIDLLAHAQPRVPYYPGGKYGKASTGKLRKSGRAWIRRSDRRSMVIARGQVDGTVQADVSRITAAWVGRGRSLARFFQGNVSYSRISKDGRDIALWTHEQLLPFEERPLKKEAKYRNLYFARGANTGPKYLELPWLQRKRAYESWIKKAVHNIHLDVKKIMRVTKRKRDAFTVDEVEAITGAIVRLGYFESRYR